MKVEHVYSLAAFAVASVGLTISPASAMSLLTNGGFETGDLSGWMQDAGTASVVSSSNEMNPSLPLSGSFFLSSSNADGAALQGGDEIAISQSIDVSSFSFIGSGAGVITANGFFSGSPGSSQPSDDLAQIVVEFYENGLGGTLLSSVETMPIDPVVGFYNPVSILNASVPSATDTLVYRVITSLDPGFSSIDIGGDDFSLELKDVNSVPTPTLFPALLGFGMSALRKKRKATQEA